MHFGDIDTECMTLGEYRRLNDEQVALLLGEQWRNTGATNPVEFLGEVETPEPLDADWRADW